MKRVILTGASGYLGSKLLSKLLNNNYTVLCPLLRDAPLGYMKPWQNRVEIIYTDTNDFSQRMAEYSPDIIIHTACRYDKPGIPLEEIVDANLTFPLRILNAVLQKGENILWINTDTALERMLNAYSLSKHQFAEWGKYYAEKGNLDFCNILLEQFYGKGDSGAKLFPFLLKKMRNNEAIDLTDGKQRRDIIYVDDVTEAYLFLCNHFPGGYKEVPLGTGVAPQIREVVEYLAEQVGTSSELRFGALAKRTLEPEISVAETSILKEMGFVCRYSWQEGIKRMVKEEI